MAKHVDVLAELLAAAKSIQSQINRGGNWEDGCFYYNGRSASELQGPMIRLSDAITLATTQRVGGGHE